MYLYLYLNTLCKNFKYFTSEISEQIEEESEPPAKTIKTFFSGLIK